MSKRLHDGFGTAYDLWVEEQEFKKTMRKLGVEPKNGVEKGIPEPFIPTGAKRGQNDNAKRAERTRIRREY